MAIHGAVKTWDATRKYGFIRRDDGESDVFVHVSEVKRSPIRTFDRGTRVCFQVALFKGRPAACDLRDESALTDGEAVIAQIFKR